MQRTADAFGCGLLSTAHVHTTARTLPAPLLATDQRALDGPLPVLLPRRVLRLLLDAQPAHIHHIPRKRAAIGQTPHRHTSRAHLPDPTHTHTHTHSLPMPMPIPIPIPLPLPLPLPISISISCYPHNCSDSEYPHPPAPASLAQESRKDTNENILQPE